MRLKMDRLLHGRVIFIRYLFFQLFFTGILSFVHAQPRLTVSVSEKEIGKNDYVEIQFNVENAGHVDQISPPSFGNFHVVSGPVQESGMTSVNGDIKRFVGIGYVLKPKTTGTFLISPATAIADGKNIRSGSVTIVVTKNSPSTAQGGNSFSSPFANLTLDVSQEPQVHQYDEYILRKGDDIADKIRRNIFVNVETTKQSCYVGEPIVATYKLYTRLKSESNVTKSPSLNGFSVSELGNPSANNLSTQKFQGRDYSVYELRKVQLYPLQPGSVELDPAEVENKITFIKAEYADPRKGDVFNEMMRDFANTTAPPEAIVQKAITLASTPKYIQVKPLPEAKKPVDFKGAVGSFTIAATLEKKNLSTDDAGMLRIIVSGAGNFQMINAPKVTWPEEIEGYEPKTLENISKTEVPMQGEKVFSYPFTVAKAGSYELSGPVFSYFDPSSRSYKTITTTGLNLTVTQGSGVRHAPQSKQVADKSNGDNGNPNSLYTWIIAAITILVGLLIIWFIRNHKQQRKEKEMLLSEVIPVHKPSATPEHMISRNPFNAVERKLIAHDHRGFYDELQRSLRTYLSEKLGISQDQLTRKRISERLDTYNVGIGTSLMLNKLMDEIDMNLYAPMSTDNEMEIIYQKAMEVAGLLDKQIKQA